MPGIAASTRLTCSFGPAPNPTAAPENSLALEATWAWTSRPRTISHGPVRPWISLVFAVSLMGVSLIPLGREVKRDHKTPCANVTKWPQACRRFTASRQTPRGKEPPMKSIALAAVAAALIAGPALAQEHNHAAHAAPAAAAAGALSVESTPISEIIKNEKAKAA